MMKVSIGAGLSALLVAGLLSFGGVGAASAASVMKQCGDEWKAAKAAGTTNGQTWQDFLKTCRVQKEGAAAPAPAPAPAAAAAPAPTPTPTPQPMKPAPAPMKPAAAPMKPAAAPTGAGQFTTEAEAKGRCPTDTVVWVNTKSHKYHYSGHRSYGTTKQGAYMCEADANAAGDVAAKGEKPKS
jgi:hypothetical protein